MTDESLNYAEKSEPDFQLYETLDANDGNIEDAKSQHDYQQNPAYGAKLYRSIRPASQPVSQKAQLNAESNGPVTIPLMNAVRNI